MVEPDFSQKNRLARGHDFSAKNQVSAQSGGQALGAHRQKLFAPILYQRLGLFARQLLQHRLKRFAHGGDGLFAAALRAAELNCDALFKGTSVDGVYDDDPKKNASAKRYEHVDYDTVLADNLKVMDASAVALCRDNAIPIVVFSIREQGNLARVLAGQGTQTIVQKISA